MLVNVLLFIVGLGMLIKGGDWFVDSASGIARRFRLPELLIGATVVSIGTTLPEVMVSAQGAMAGSGGMAYGNAIGSIICNTSLIAAITVAIKPGRVERSALIMPVSFFFVAATLYMAVAYLTGQFSRMIGIVLLALFLTYMIATFLQMKKTPAAELDGYVEEEPPAQEITEKKGSLVKEILLLVIGAALIAFGANLLVDNGTAIAEKLGVPDTVIALTFVALGTSLPELVTAITSLIKGHGALSLGNIIGANLFNLVLVGGVSTVISPFPVPSESTIGGMPASLVLDLPVMLGVMLILILPTLICGKLSRAQGIGLLCVYVTFCTLQFVM
ncbi:MAG: calcium/sodium antiporter [Clostridia bacterium]|nr:calcium/sodium antiporter [Clostridia bacterium]